MILARRFVVANLSIVAFIGAELFIHPKQAMRIIHHVKRW
jgi:hypothetical protein